MENESEPEVEPAGKVEYPIFQIVKRVTVLALILGFLYSFIRPQFRCAGCGTCGGGEVDIFFTITLITGFFVIVFDSLRKSKLPVPEDNPVES